MKKRFSTLILILVFFTGLTLLLYPSVSDWWNSFHQSRAIAEYASNIQNLEKEVNEKLLSDARAYNEKLSGIGNRFQLSEEAIGEYNSLLDITGTGIMGYIEIPEIKVSLPIYHGTSDSVLSIAIGHIEGSSLPVGGEGTHCVLSGHRGLPSAKLFSNLDRLREGDTFTIRTLDEALTYEVDQIHIVEPHEIGDLAIEEGMDYCTLVTCTPYGINTHRLLVRGHRIEDTPGAAAIRVTSDAIQIDPVLVAPIVAIPMILLLLILLFALPGKRKPNRR